MLDQNKLFLSQGKRVSHTTSDGLSAQLLALWASWLCSLRPFGALWPCDPHRNHHVQCFGWQQREEALDQSEASNFFVTRTEEDECRRNCVFYELGVLKKPFISSTIYGRKFADRTKHEDNVIFFVFLATVFGNLEVCNVKKWNIFLYISAGVYRCLRINRINLLHIII